MESTTAPPALLDLRTPAGDPGSPRRGDPAGDDDVPVRYAGLVTRAVALVIDLLTVNAIATLVGGAVNLVASAFGHRGGLDVTQATVGAVLWAVWVGSYFAGFWTLTGQTPGNRVLAIRVVGAAGGTISATRALLRFAGLVIAALPLGAGFLPVLVDDRRRGLHDRIAGSVVIWVD